MTRYNRLYKPTTYGLMVNYWAVTHSIIRR